MNLSDLLVEFKSYEEISNYKPSEELSEKILMANKFLYFVDELCMSSLGSMIASKELCLEITNWMKKLSKSTIWNLPFQVLTLSTAFKLPELFAVVDTVSAYQDSDTGDDMCTQFWQLFNSITSQYNRFFTLKKEAFDAFDFGDPGKTS